MRIADFDCRTMALASGIIALLGLSLGSFINSCAYRLPRRISLVTPRSFCPECQAQLRWFELIPVLSYIGLRGKCGHCHSKISLIYPVLEILVVAMTVLLFLIHGVTWTFLTSCIFFLLVLVVGVIDWKHQVIPNAVVVTGLISGLLLRILPAEGRVTSALLGSAICFGSMLSIRLLGTFVFRKDVMGMGDVKLAGVIGLFVGIQDFFVSLWLASVLGTTCWMVARIVKSRGITRSPSDQITGLPYHQLIQSTRLPFGTFLSCSSFAVCLLQPDIDLFLNSWLISIS